jgi:Protein of unknown function (DUF3592)
MSGGQITGFSIGAVLVMAFGLFWVIVGRRGRRDLERLRQTGYRATGVVIDYRYERDSDGGAVPYPMVRFPGPDGGLITAVSDFGGSFVPDEGDEVAVLYDPARPGKVHLEYAASDRVSTIFQAIGWVLMGGSAIALLVAQLLYFVFWDAVWGPR